MELPKTADVVVVGGGVMGVSTAYHLARKGARNIVLLERNSMFGLEATGKCAGGIRYQFATEINIRLSQISLPMLDRFEEELGQAIDVRHCGYLFLLTREQDVKTFQANVALQHKLGVMTEWLTGEEVRRRLPLMRAEDVLAATWYPRDGLADPNGVVQGYVSAARRMGARCLTDVEITGFGKKTADPGHTDQAGDTRLCWAAWPLGAQIGKMAGVEIPVVPVRRQIAVTTPIPELPPDFPFVLEFAKNLYFHREGPAILTGMSNLNEPAGFDQHVDREWELVHFDAAMERMPLLEKAGISNRWAGLYEVSPDAHPILEGSWKWRVSFRSADSRVTGSCTVRLWSFLAEEILDGKAHAGYQLIELTRFRKEDRLSNTYVVEVQRRY
jgi:sarcosine oxidase subunit beta